MDDNEHNNGWIKKFEWEIPPTNENLYKDETFYCLWTETWENKKWISISNTSDINEAIDIGNLDNLNKLIKNLEQARELFK